MTFCCFKQCLKLRPKALENLHNKYDIAMCPHIRNRTGFSKHMYVKSASGGEKPRVLNSSRADILSQMAAIVLLLKRAFKFIVKITILFRQLHRTNDPNIKEKLKPPSVPKSIMNLIQME